jgi:phosphonate degradation associated HDIG domain protein
MSAILDQVSQMLTLGSDRRYGGEAVSQLEHALQCAFLAEQAGKSPELITACLLHDIGHLLRHLNEGAPQKGKDDKHEDLGAQFLSSSFGPAVVEAVRLHVNAKRYLCLVDKDYWASLSPISKYSLELQGGIFSEEEAAAFIEQPYAQDAVQLRIWDDQAKIQGLATPDLSHFEKYIQESIR